MENKKKLENTQMDEVHKTMYIIFCNVANSLSELYTHAQHQ
jgi:hypothetical protein